MSIYRKINVLLIIVKLLYITNHILAHIILANKLEIIVVQARKATAASIRDAQKCVQSLFRTSHFDVPTRVFITENAFCSIYTARKLFKMHFLISKFQKLMNFTIFLVNKILIINCNYYKIAYRLGSANLLGQHFSGSGRHFPSSVEVT